MRVLSFSYCFPNRVNPNWGIFVYQRLAALARREELQVCSPVPWFPVLSARRGDPGPEKDVWKGLTVYRPRFFYFPTILKNHDACFYAQGVRRWFLELCRTWRPDVLDAHFIWPDGVAVALLAKELNIPYVITLRGKLYDCLTIPSQRRKCAAALQDASVVISVSRRLSDKVRELGVSDDCLMVIPNGIDCKYFYPMDKRTCRRNLCLPEEGRLLVTVAHLGHRKGHHEVIRTLADLPNDVRLAIVGGPVQGGTPEKLRAVAAEVGVENRLILPGLQPYKKIPMYFSAADVSVLASYREGCSNAVLESLACGTPVVASDVGAVHDILPVPKAGRIVPPRKIEPLKEALADVLDHQWISSEVVKASGIKSWNGVAQEVQKVLRKVVSCSRPLS
jgi:glycosyltransferase involved in cell wall biosynthesis